MAKEITKLKHRPPFKHILALAKNIIGLWPQIIILVIVAFLAFANYQPNTTLTGWDNLHPEFNFALDIKRSLFAVWQEYRGLGLLGGMAHGSDLTRELLLMSFHSLGVPTAMLRYLWVFISLAIGPLAVFYFLKAIVLRSKFDPKTTKFASFLGALFYLLNLATLQYFFTPFETFHSFYAFLPLILLALTHYLEKPSLKNFLCLTLILIFSGSSFYVQTLFVVLLFCVLPILWEFVHHNKFRKKSLVVSINSLVTTILTQTYWLLPVAFFALTNGGVTGQAHINLISSPETYYRNLEFANLKDIALLKGYWFNYLDISTGYKYDYLLLPWRSHLASPIIQTIGYLSFALVLTGIYYALKKKIPYARASLVIFLISGFFLVGGGQLLGGFIPLVSEIFRSPFTKFSVSLSLAYSVFFAIGTIFLLDLFTFLHSELTYYLTLFTVSLALIVFMTPAFTGNLISGSMRISFPDEYQELFLFMQSQDHNTRVANFPQYTFWGWNYYDWGYRGSGFLWFGLPQTLLDRAFDVWDPNSEKYYEKISAALYNENQKEFENDLDRFSINWLIIDRNVIAPSPDIDLGLTKLQKLLDANKAITLEKVFGDSVFLYKTNLYQRVNNFISVSSPSPETRPFESISLRPTKSNETNGQQVTLMAPLTTKPKRLTFPSFSQTESLLPVELAYRKTATGLELKFSPILPEIHVGDQQVNLPSQPNTVEFNLTEFRSGLIIGINDQYFEIQLPDELAVQNTFFPLANTYLPTNKNINLTLYSSTPTFRRDLTGSFSAANPYQCYTDKPNRKIEKILEQGTISLIGIDMVGCLSATIPNASSLNQLISLEFTYWSSTNTPANANITDSSLGGESSPQALVAKERPTFTRIYAKPSFRPLQANLILEANETKNTAEINYRDAVVSYLPQLGEGNFFLNSISSQAFESDSDNLISISIPLLDSSLTQTSTPDHNLFSAQPINCDNFNRGKFDRQVTKDGFLYTATGANSCDQINLKYFPHNTHYALVIDSENLAGLFPTVCLENYTTRRCDVFERLVDGKQMIIQPISNPNESPGYTLHLFNQSFGNLPVRNLIKSVTVAPIPLNFLRNITSVPLVPEPEVESPGQITLRHPAEFLYQATIIKSGSAPLNLFQTNSPYWKALVVSESDLALPTWLLVAKIPHLYFFAKDKTAILPHNDTNLWYNSWDLPPGTHHLVIFYLPQYLEFAGFLLLPLPLIGSLIYLLFHKKSPR
ncbi:hypothetical protein A3D09_00495 [Candidatus Collierbacteria bacterium RIFCSPHIGHO2_02_FULL_49_10]|uniref:Membrane protein 6-pyruvoyl-tetrahydropterin synthase-related domain-containing protein n=1 Tax=Candidatus Collierbacteria bacterium RIFCSPHIGHO2_02_FULL_49_10 TaxID=1817723 RepID=A0A1F5ET33_9BACT|nr:MAG: hypothetical protein A3D09_00495 [Candidatus Collierbacteria bacterium RIFCSPHIGHO2_02_FULL_49_10]